MKIQKVFHSSRRLGYVLVLCLVTLGWMFAPLSVSAEERTTAAIFPPTQAFMPGETLTYEISWSKIVTAGIAVMEVKEERLPDGRKVFRFIATSHSVGLVDEVYPVNDRVESLFDPRIRQSLSFSINESHGKRKRHRSLAFDHAGRTVVSRLNNDPPQTMTIPNGVQDALSSLFYLRTMADFTIGKTHTIEVNDSGKNWSVEVFTLGREKVKTPAGEFNTIKVKTFPRYEGVFMNKGEIFIWLTDDSRKIPVLMKSMISIGSIMTTLTDMKLGEVAH